MCRYNGESDIHYSVIAKYGQDSVFFTWQLVQEFYLAVFIKYIK
jgi:hypothetical protein